MIVVGVLAIASSSALPLTMTLPQRGYEMGQFDWTPDQYLERIRSKIPRYDELQEQAIAAIPFSPERVLELGMGTGETTRRLIEAYPDAWVVGLDASPDMVFRARQTYDDVQLARMEDPLPDGPWDLVISVLSVNDLDDNQKKALFRRVRDHSRSLVIGDTFEQSQLDDVVEWCGGKVTWQADNLAVVSASY
jgi:tRNA (cmo5U34)-methyltransferase